MSDDEKDEAIFRVDTVPPPAGEDDAYSAPTRVGPMAAAVVEEMMVASVRKTAELTAAAEKAAAAEKQAVEAAAKKNTPVVGAVAPARAITAKRAPAAVTPSTEALGDSDLIPDPTPSTRGSSSTHAASKAPPVPVKPLPPAAGPPRVYDEVDDEENAATLLSRSAKAPIVEPIAATPSVPPAPEFPSAPRAAVASPLAPSGTAPLARTPAASPLPLQAFLPLALGFAVFAIGLILYFWAR